MKKVIFILLLSLTLASCNHENKYPTSLFGVKLLDKATNYMSESEWNAVKNKNKNVNIFATYKGNFKRNNLFDDTFMYVNPNTEIIYVVGAISYNQVSLNRFKNKCDVKRSNLLNSLREIKQIRKSNFKKSYFIRETNENGIVSDTYIELYSLSYNKENYVYSLEIECKFSYDNDYNSVQKLIYTLTAADKLNEVTDKNLLEKLNKKRMKSTTILKKPLTDENIKNDFRGI